MLPPNLFPPVHQHVSRWRYFYLCWWIALWLLLALTSQQVAAQEIPSHSLNVSLANAVTIPSRPGDDGGLALDNELLGVGACDEMLYDLTLLDALPNFIASTKTLYHYKILDSRSITDVLRSTTPGCQLFPNYLIALNGTHSTFGSPHDNPNQPVTATLLAPAHANLLTRINKVTTSATGAGITVALFDTYCAQEAGRYSDTLTFLGSKLNPPPPMAQQRAYTTPILATFTTVTPTPVRTPSATPTPLPVPTLPPVHPPQCPHVEALTTLLTTVAPKVTLEFWQVLDENGLGTLFGLLHALHDFYQTPSASSPYVINLSLGVLGDLRPITELQAVLENLTGVGHIVVAAAGNWGDVATAPVSTMRPQYPAAYPFVIAVHATDTITGGRTAYSNRGAYVGAPGGADSCQVSNGVLTSACLLFLNSRSQTGVSGWRGTSYATALVSGAAAVLLEQDPTLSAWDVPTLLRTTAVPSTTGLLNIDGAIGMAGQLQKGDCNKDATVDAGDISALVLESFDDDDNTWLAADGSIFPGSPLCDANQDRVIDAGDISCAVLLIFNGPGACS